MASTIRIKHLIKALFFLIFVRVKQTPEQEIEVPISFLVKPRSEITDKKYLDSKASNSVTVNNRGTDKPVRLRILT